MKAFVAKSFNVFTTLQYCQGNLPDVQQEEMLNPVQDNEVKTYLSHICSYVLKKTIGVL